jgi:hypothetical protein
MSELIATDWTQADWQAALSRVPALVLTVIGGIALGQPAAGVVAAGACLSVGLVGKRKVAGSSLLAMTATTAAMAFSAWAGTLVGASPWLNPVVTALWGLAFAFLTIHDEDLGWIGMQAVTALVIAMAFPDHGYAALGRSAAVLAGGAAQIGLITGFGRLGGSPRGAPSAKTESAPTPAQDFKWPEFFRSFRLFSAAWPYAVRVSLTMILAVEIERRLPMQNGYWLPMTTIIILKPDFYRTYSGAIQRVAGTFLGVVLASLIAHLLHPRTEWLVALAALFSFGCFALIKVNPILFSAALTAYVIFVIAVTGLPETTITWHRLIYTALGSALALGSRFLGYQSMVGLFGHKPKLAPKVDYT